MDFHLTRPFPVLPGLIVDFSRRARAADGDNLAPYETTLADLYLVKAQEEQSHSHYPEATELAAESLKAAGLAEKKAAGRGAPPEGQGFRSTPQQRPPAPVQPPRNAPDAGHGRQAQPARTGRPDGGTRTDGT